MGKILLLLYVLLYHVLRISSEPLEVTCPPLASSQGSPLMISTKSQTNHTEYCDCSLFISKPGRTVIVKCDFKFEKDIVLTSSLFPFRNESATSAYVRMTNSRSVVITSAFLQSLMDSPSSALDLWHCGRLSLASTPQMPDIHKKLKTFFGIGIVNCTVKSLPKYLFRDRSRAAIRVSGCAVGAVQEKLFHKIDEVRYVAFEDSVIERVTGPLSSSGSITLSKRSLHTWDGLVLANVTIFELAPMGFNITHMSDMEQLIIRSSTINNIGTGSIVASGDIYVTISGSVFKHVAPKAFQIAVNGPIVFSDNAIHDPAANALAGLTCGANDTFRDVTLYVTKVLDFGARYNSTFGERCQEIKIEKIVAAEQVGLPSYAATLLSILALGIIMGIVVGSLWVWRRNPLYILQYRRGKDPLLFGSDRTPEGEEDPQTLQSQMPTEGRESEPGSSIVILEPCFWKQSNK